MGATDAQDLTARVALQDGPPRADDCSVSYRLAGEQRALATIAMDRLRPSVEHGMESAVTASSEVDKRLDQALELTFPASDPIAIDRLVD